ncbi:MAG: hypothetical protein U5J64_10005 [Halobacteriales archaeon]|nr:hypothetical protein [Halobacteriales archaeon]
MNGTRCRRCGNFVYARDISGYVDPCEVVCYACREFECISDEPRAR